MFTRIFVLAAVVALAVAGPAPLTLRGQCNTGSISCCNTVQSVSQAQPTLQKLNLVDVAAQAAGQVGFNCVPISVIGTGSGAQCQQQPVCCQNNHYNGLVNVGCSPINLSG